LHALRGVSDLTGGEERSHMLHRFLHRQLGRLSTHPLAVGVDESHVRKTYQAQDLAKVGNLKSAAACGPSLV